MCWAKRVRMSTRAHPCASIFVRTFVGIMYYSASYPNQSHLNWPLNPYPSPNPPLETESNSMKEKSRGEWNKELKDTAEKKKGFGISMRAWPLQGRQKMDEEWDKGAEWGEKTAVRKIYRGNLKANTWEKTWEAKVLQGKERTEGIKEKTSSFKVCHLAACHKMRKCS